MYHFNDNLDAVRRNPYSIILILIHVMLICMLYIGVTIVPNFKVKPWSHDGGPKWQWKVNSLECAVEGFGKPRRNRRSCTCH